jgi:hypothetical protein
MKLDESQKNKVAAWINDGLKLSEIQKRMESELGLRLTYMEVRFLVDDLKLVPKDPEPPKPPVAATTPEPALSPVPPVSVAGGVSVVLDQIARPGALVSGNVTFSDGQTAAWQLDQTGRLGLTTAQPGYKPTAEDVKAFQLELQNQFAKMGL